MGLDFDAIEYCKKLKVNQPDPPFDCPVEKCDKNYKSVCGLQYHLVNFDHDNPQPVTPLITPYRKKGRSRLISMHKSQIELKTSPKEGVVYSESDHTIQYDIDGKSVKVSANEPLPIISEEEYVSLLERGSFGPTAEIPPEPYLKLPEASFKEIESYNISK